MHPKLQSGCEIYVVKMYLVRKHLNQLFDSNICRAGEQTNSCIAAEWHPRSLKQHTTNLGGSYLRQMLFVSDTQLGENLSPVTSNRASSLLYLCSQRVLKNIFNTKLDCITFLHTELFVLGEKKTTKSSNQREYCFLLCDYKANAFNLVMLSIFAVGMVLNATKHPESWN